MQPMMSESIDLLMAALAQAQGEITPAVKDSANPYFKSKYADLSSISAASRLPLSKAGLAVCQTMATIDGTLTLVTTLGHTSGQWMRSYAPILTAKLDSQSVGSAITYMRRYSLAAMVGVVTDDDDGEGSMARDRAQPQGAGRPKYGMPPKEAAADPRISTQEGAQLFDLLEACSESYRAQIGEYFKKSGTDAFNLPRSIYAKLLPAVMKEQAAYASSQEVTA
jgi:hypothetical protein